ncbi:hypothetical protein HF086_002339, partial [Spodoptera exigua]
KVDVGVAFCSPGPGVFELLKHIEIRLSCSRMFGSGGACAACGQAIPASEFVMRTNAPQQPLHVFHIKCFACSKCGSHLMQGDRYYMLAGSLVCEQDWQKLMKSANATGAPGAPMRKNKVGRPRRSRE